MGLKPLPYSTRGTAREKGSLIIWGKTDCGQGQNRTADTQIFSLLLYRLSYLPVRCRRTLHFLPIVFQTGQEGGIPVEKVVLCVKDVWAFGEIGIEREIFFRLIDERWIRCA